VGDDPFDLERFVQAQAPVYPDVLAELRAARKRTHWMWFVFPQLAGLGSSGMAQRYALRSREEARAYLAHPVLGPRLRECSAVVLAAAQDDIHRIFGSPDDLKFGSCMTLFAHVAAEEPVFRRCIERFFGAAPDPRTLALLGPA
jgi:uncharacterized protein (DUF1810 family)